MGERGGVPYPEHRSTEVQDLLKKRRELLDKLDAEKLKLEIAELERKLAAQTFWEKLRERLGR